ncbi:MAG: NYN domain-containing protein [Chloroflexi bacterium]|nr:NYN domain-containing protein [Chloroflexota bacterium]
MPDQTKDFVALFIDWDNIAISTAADLNGASPDVKRIVQAAQQYGVILVARAYAEWPATSERLTVYRAGIDTVYAPTFRYETDPVTQTSRGKSLADPCMVADCVDILHLLPSISTFVIVSGDKDLIPVVRLAQLRGKKVVVIGPDFAAGVLREIADEFISYRKVIEGANGKTGVEATEFTPAPRHRQQGRGSSQSFDQSGAAPSRSSRGGHGPASTVRPRSQEVRHATSHPEAAATPPITQEVLAAEPALKPETPPELAERQLPDLQSVHSAVLEILRQRTADGKPRTRATNLKDSLMVKLPGFSERRYGFSKFKDFLTAMEKSGEISITSAGPVHWVSLPAPAEPDEGTAAPSVEQKDNEPRTSAGADAAVTDEQQVDLVRFLLDLKNRSRWLTYTYVLTNLITHLSKVKPGVSAEGAARSVLNQLVQDGLLRVDKEPQEVEVGGIKHRVRMCHIEATHPMVAQLIAGEPTQAATEEQAVTSADRTTELGGQAAVEGDDESKEVDKAAYDIQVAFASPSAIGEPEEQAIISEPSANGAQNQVADQEKAPVEPSEQPRRGSESWPDASGIADDVHRAILESQRSAEVESTHREEESYQKPVDLPATVVGVSASSLEEAMEALGKIVRDSTGPSKPRVGIAGLKAKLNGALGHFDEQEFGFSRFKDFLMAAEKAGHMQVEKSGSAIWVRPRETAEANEELPPQVHQEEEPKQDNGKRRRRSGRKKSAAEATV